MVGKEMLSDKGRNLGDRLAKTCIVVLIAMVAVVLLIGGPAQDIDDVDGASYGATTWDSGKCKVTLANGTLEVTSSSGGQMLAYTIESLPEWLQYTSSITTVKIQSGVTSVGSFAFYGCSAVTSVSIANSVKEIGYCSFQGCSGFKSVSLPNNLTTIANNAFNGCSSLGSITIPDSVTTIGDDSAESGCFQGCTSLTTVKIGTGMKYVHKYMFSGCTSLSSVTLSDNVKTIGRDAFNGCTSLASIDLNEVTDIDYYAFYGCTQLASITADDVQTISRLAFAKTGLTSLYLPSIVSFDGGDLLGSFYSCTALVSVELGSSMTTIGKGAFESCTALTTVTIGDNVSVIDDYAFYKCSKLESINTTTSLTAVNTMAFYECGLLESVELSKVTTIGNYAFYGCAKLVSIDLSSITVTGNEDKITSYFMGCTSLSTVTIGNSFTYIPKNMFNGCTSLSTVTIGTSVARILTSAFAGCTSIQTLLLPDSVVLLDSNAFAGCTQLKSINLGKVTTFGNYVFNGCKALQTVNLASFTNTSSEDSSKGLFQGCTSLSSVTLGNSMTFITKYMFSGCTSLNSVTFGTSVTKILRNAFDGCIAFKTFSVPKTVTVIEYQSFMNCSGLSSITIPDSITKMAEAFNGCNNLTTVTIIAGASDADNNLFSNYLKYWKLNGQNVGTIRHFIIESGNIGENNFNSIVRSESGAGGEVKRDVRIADGLEAYDLNGGLKYEIYINYGHTLDSLTKCKYGGLTFVETQTQNGIVFNYEQLYNPNETVESKKIYWVFGTVKDETATYDNSLLIIGSGEMGAVDNIPWESLKSQIYYVYFDKDITTFAANIFSGCTNFQTFLGLPTKITSVGESAFDGCENLYNPEGGAMIFENLVTVGDNAFRNCKALSLNVTKVTTSIGENAFMNSKIEYLEASCTTIEANAFNGCSSLSEVVLTGNVSISAGAFDGCEKLSKITLLDSAEIMGEAFSGCGIQTITIKSGSSNVSSTLFDTDNLGSWKLNGQTSSTITTIKVESSNLSSDNIYALTHGTTTANNTIELGEEANYTFKDKGLYVSGMDCETDRNGLVFKYADGKFNCTSQTCGENLYWVYDMEERGEGENQKILYILGSGQVIEDAEKESDVGWYDYREEILLVSMPSTVTMIGAYAFCGCTSLYYFISYPTELALIGYRALQDCSSLEIDLWTTHLEYVGAEAFDGCTKTTIYDISTLRYIGNNAFRGTQIITTTIADSVILEDSAFNGCGSLSELTIVDDGGEINANLFSSTNLGEWKLPGMGHSLSKITIKSDRLIGSSQNYNYMTVLTGNKYDNRVLILGDEVGTAYDGAGNGLYVSGEDVATPRVGLTFVCTNNKYNCTSQTCGTDLYWVLDTSNGDLYITGTGSKMNDYDDEDNKAPWRESETSRLSIKKVIFPISITDIGEYAFEECDELLTFGGQPTRIITVGAHAFNGCGKLAIGGITLTFVNLVSVGSYAFAGCPMSMAVKSTLTSVGAHAFEGTGLTTVNVSCSIGDYAFNGCESLAEAHLFSGASVGAHAFEVCTGLTFVEICDTVEIGTDSFSGCGKMKVMIIEGTGTVSSTLFDDDNLSDWKLNGMTAGYVTAITITTKNIKSKIAGITDSYYEGNQIILSGSVGNTYDEAGLGLYVGGIDIAEPKATMTFTGMEIDSSNVKNVYNAPQHTAVMIHVQFDTDGGSPIDSIDIEITSSEYTLDLTGYSTAKDHNHFTGWYNHDKKCEKNVTFIYGSFSDPEIILATWELNAHNVTFVYGNGTDPTVKEYAYGSEISKPADPTWIGHKFEGWDKEIPETMPDYPVTITAQWSLVTYHVEYRTEHGTGTMDNTDFNYNDGTTLRLNKYEYSGYNFYGWSTSAGGEKEYSNGDSLEGIHSDIVLYAIWVPITFTVNFDHVDGSGSMKSQAFTYDVPQNLNDNEFKREGYNFYGWSLTAHGELKYLNKQSVSNLTTVDKGTVTLYAVWKPCVYTVVFDSYGGSGTMEDQTFHYGEEPKLISTNLFTKEGNHIIGWHHKGLNINYGLDEKVSFSYTSDQEITLEALWSPNTYSIKIVLYDEVTDTASIEFGSKVSIKQYEREGYLFTKWTGDEIPEFMPARNDLVIYANWDIQSYDFTIVYYEGSEKTDKIEYGTKITVETPEREGYSFTEWTGDPIPETMPAKNIKIYANWTINSYTVTFIIDGDEVPVTQNYGTELKAPKAEKVGYEFTKWDKEVPETMPARNDLVITAQWAVKQYKLTLVYGNGDLPKTVPYDFGAQLSVENPTWYDHTFVEWSPAIPLTMPAEDITCTAQWIDVVYGLTIEYNNGQDTVVKMYAPGAAVIVETPTYADHILAGWNIKVPSVMPRENLVLSAVWGVEVDEIIVVDVYNGQQFVPILETGKIELRIAENMSVTLDASEVKDKMTGLSITETEKPTSKVSGKAYVVELTVNDTTDLASVGVTSMLVTLPTTNEKTDVYMYLDGEVTEMNIVSVTNKKVTFEATSNATYIVDAYNSSSEAIALILALIGAILAAVMVQVLFIFALLGSKKDRRKD